jgi:hypothetical protein
MALRAPSVAPGALQRRQVAARVLIEPHRAEAAPCPAAQQAPPALLRPVVFSAKRYVHDFLEAPLTEAFPEARFFEVGQPRQPGLQPSTPPAAAASPIHTLLPPPTTPPTTHLQTRLSPKTAKLAEGADAVIIFVNDNCSAEVSCKTY